MSNDQLVPQIVALLLETGQAHHRAYIETDGADPEWPLWYAEYLQDKLGRLLNHPLTRSELVYYLVRLNKAYTSQARKRTWDEYYAQELVEQYNQ
jgi:NAD(P)H-hydrate epimerase